VGLVNAKEVAKAIKVDKLGLLGTAMGWSLMRLLKIDTLNKIYDRNCHLSELEFINCLISEFEINFDIPKKDLKRLPKTGPFITISNHPLGGIDGILLLKLLLESRPDFKIIANFLLHRIEPLKPYVMPVNPFEQSKSSSGSIAGFKSALTHLQSGFGLGIFPAGEVSTYRDGKLLVDKSWEVAAMKLIKRAEVPVVPIYFHAQNSSLFYRLARISDTLRTAKLPSELLTQKQRVIRVRIGRPIAVEDQKQHESLSTFTKFLRKKTYVLSNPYQKKPLLEKLPSAIKLTKFPKSIAGAVEPELMALEVQELRSGSNRLLECKNYEVFLADPDQIPNLLKEIGRLREITFREIGEGTNKPTDLDEFDGYYKHLFLWDNKALQIVGAYRMGLGQEIFQRFGINGFYLQKLFRFDSELYHFMAQSIEMGRAFLVKSYQQRPMPLFLLWKGIVHTTLRYPDHKYLIGGVSISNKFSEFSKGLMIEFMKSNYYDPYLAQYIKPKKEYKVKLKDGDKDFIFDATAADLNKFDKIIDELEPGSLRLPVLLKKYIKQNAKVVAFNVDPLFNNAIDGLMYIRIADLPESTVKPVMEEFQAELERQDMDSKV